MRDTGAAPWSPDLALDTEIPLGQRRTHFQVAAVEGSKLLQRFSADDLYGPLRGQYPELAQLTKDAIDVDDGKACCFSDLDLRERNDPFTIPEPGKLLAEEMSHPSQGGASADDQALPKDAHFRQRRSP